jgi:sortase A
MEIQKAKNPAINKFFILGCVSLSLALAITTAFIFSVQTNRTINAIPKKTLAAETTYTEPAQQVIDKNFQKFGLYISKLNLKVPITANVDGTNKNVYNAALGTGLAHYKGTLLPGQGGNIFIFGHSAAADQNAPYYAYDFAKISNLSTGDKIVLVKNGQEFNYKVIERKIVSDDDLSALAPTNSEIVTLMTCYPPGKLDSRLIIRASLI